jgi:hypothetical protein
MLFQNYDKQNVANKAFAKFVAYLIFFLHLPALFDLEYYCDILIHDIIQFKCKKNVISLNTE